MKLDKTTDFTINDLLQIMQALRDPDSGCPWDQVQNFASIAPYTIEEAYEVADAIARDDNDSMQSHASSNGRFSAPRIF